MVFLPRGLTSPVSCLVFAHKLLSGGWKLFLGSQLPFYFQPWVREDEIPGQGGRPTGAAAGGSGSPAARGLPSC